MTIVNDPLVNLCEADRKFAEHTAFTWKHDLPWELGFPPASFLSEENQFRRRNRENMDLWRRLTGLDWVRTANGRIGP